VAAHRAGSLALVRQRLWHPAPWLAALRVRRPADLHRPAASVVSRLIDEMEREAAKLSKRADGYRMAGEGRLAGDTRNAAVVLRLAIAAINVAAASEKAAKHG